MVISEARMQNPDFANSQIWDAILVCHFILCISCDPVSSAYGHAGGGNTLSTTTERALRLHSNPHFLFKMVAWCCVYKQ